MNLRSVLFWTHLSMGVIAGLIVLFLSLTGVLLMYEHKIVDALAARETVAAPAGAKPRTVDEIASIARERSKGALVIVLNYENREGAPVVAHPVGPGDLHELTLDPYAGEDFTGTSAGVKSFFETMVGWHRWLGAEGGARGMGRMVTGAANLLFAFMLITGIYLWLPKIWKWALLRPKILFRRNPGAGKARDYNWHHVFSFWALIPLVLIVGSGVIISYPWANAAFYRAFGAEAPKQGGPAFFKDLRREAAMTVAEAEVGQMATLQNAVDAAKGTNANWTKIGLFVHPKPDVPIVRVLVHDGNGVLPEQMSTVVFDRRERRITAVQKYDDMAKVEKGRMWIRFIHTGEQYGFIGSTIAGLASLAAIFLVYTGLALSLRRLQDYRRRRKLRPASRDEAESVA
jgi:uncharacterized iron-regulated membrane protein